MDTASLATAIVSSQAAQTQYAVAGLIARTNAGQAAAIAGLVDAAASNAAKLSQLPQGVGGSLDVSV